MTDAVVAGGATFVALATVIIGAFMTGKIVAGKTFDRVLDQVDRMSAALEKRNDIDETLLRERRPLRDRGA